MPHGDRLPHALDDKARTCRAVIETPKGRRSKFDYDPQSGLFELAGLLPEGMSFPLDFGFVPSTRAEDGDPLDIMVLHDEPLAVGVLVAVRLIGVIDGEQTEGDKTVRNDRLVAVSCCSHAYEQVSTVSALASTFIDQLAAFWINDNAAKGKTFKVLGIHGPDRAVEAVKTAIVVDGKG
jgi:inorganic pyrophosphatase